MANSKNQGGAPALQQNDIPRYIPLSKWEDYFRHPTLSSMRWMVWRARHYQIEHCLKRVGRRIWIDQVAFWEWLSKQSNDVRR